MNHEPEALQLARELDTKAQTLGCPLDRFSDALRHQHARIAELEAQLYAVGAGGVGQSIKPQVQADTVIPVSVPTGWKLVPVEPTDDMFTEGMEADCRGRPSIDDDNHVRSIWRAMLSSAPDAPRPPAQSCCTCTKTADLHKAPAPAQQEPVAWRVHPFDYGVGSKGVYALTQMPEQVEMWQRKEWKVEPLYTAPQPTRQPLKDDAKRLDWLMLNISGAEFRRIGIEYSGICTRKDIDNAIERENGITESQP